MTKDSGSLVNWKWEGRVVVGLDLSDRVSTWEAVDANGEARRGKVRMTAADLARTFGQAGMRVVIEAGNQAFWVNRELVRLGHEVLVLDARQMGPSRGRRKTDREDARQLVQWGVRAGRPGEDVRTVKQRTQEEQLDLTTVRMRDSLVRARGQLISSVRGALKPYGARIGEHSAESFAKFARQELEAALVAKVEPVLAAVEALTETIKEAEKGMREVLERRSEEGDRLRQVDGVGPVTTAVLLTVVGDPRRFKNGRDLAAYLGLVPGVQQSGEMDPQLGISKAGDKLARRVLVQAAHYILGAFGKDSTLRRWGLALAGEGSSIKKRKAVIAVARKLVVLLHRLWLSGEAYEPLRGCKAEAIAA